MKWILITSIIVIVIIIINVAVVHTEKKDSEVYKDRGDTQASSAENIPSLTPANDRAGMIGEKVVNYHLNSLLRQDEYLLANLLLPLNNGHKTEIDCITLSRKGIFCIETKHWIGHIRGNDDDEYWIQEYDNPYISDRIHKNPVKQNKSHCSVLKRILNNKYDIDCAVIFADLEDGVEINSNYTYTIDQFKDWYRQLDDSVIEPNELSFIYKKLFVYVATPEQLKKHQEDIKNIYKN